MCTGRGAERTAAPQIRTHAGWMGPGSAAHHAARHSASKTRVNALMALRSIRGTRAGELKDPRRDLAAQPLQAEQRVGAGFRDLDALGGKVLAEELEMRGGFVELLWRQ